MLSMIFISASLLLRERGALKGNSFMLAIEQIRDHPRPDKIITFAQSSLALYYLSTKPILKHGAVDKFLPALRLLSVSHFAGVYLIR